MGKIKTFSSFYTDWMYGDEGYYASIKRVGKGGDFYTSVSVSRLFGGSIALEIIKQAEKFFEDRPFALIEVGAEKGFLLADIIQTIYTLKPNLLEKISFFTLEPLEVLREAQNIYFKDSFGDKIKIECVATLEEIEKKSAYIVANELFDAFPCELFDEEKMLYMDEFTPIFKEATTEIKEIAKKYLLKRCEIPLGYGEFAASLRKHFNKALFLTFDYGDVEFKNRFTLRIFKDHKVESFFEPSLDLKRLFRQCDLTYDVPFRYLRDEFERNGFSCIEFTAQNRALVDFGIIELLEEVRKNVRPKAYLAESNRVKMLLSPAFLGERFKMIKFAF